MSKEIK